MLKHRASYLVASLVLSSVACTSQAPGPGRTLQTYSSDHFYQGEEKPMCKAMLDSYCDFLNSPGVQGNLEVKRADRSTHILQGDTQNQFSQIYYRYSQAKLRNREFFPKDVARILERHAYFTKLGQFLKRRPRPGMSLLERLSTEQADFELGMIWTAAQNEAAILRMNRRYPEFHRLPEALVPIELQLERRRMRRDLISEISRAIWRGSDEWKRVEATFAKLQTSFKRVITRLDIPETVRGDWLERIANVRLVLPGAFPAIANEECGSTTANAFYFTYLNVVTVCAGDFNSEDIVQTLSHEMAHALGIDRSQYLFENQSKFGRSLSDFRHRVCEPKTFGCEAWDKFRGGFDDSLASLTGYKPQLPEFQSCLMKRPTTKDLSDADVNRFAKSLVTDRISDLAAGDRFLRITKAMMPLRNGKQQKNPNYLNPCSYSLWSQGEEPIDDDLTTLMFFTAEYRCTPAKAAPERLRDAIEVAKGMSEKVTRQSLRIAGRFSARNLLEGEGFASPPFERFADVIGSYASADLLAQSPDRWDRQNMFLASSSWQCTEPSLMSQYPEESSVEKEYIFDAHTEGEQRRKELFTTPIRQVIGCQKDFEFPECSLPFKVQ